MHRAKEQRCRRHEPLHHHQEQEEHSGASGAQEVQPLLEESHRPQRNQVTKGELNYGKESCCYPEDLDR